MSRCLLTVALAAFLLVPASSRSEDKDKADKTPTTADFIIKGLSCGTAEVKYSQLAEKRASSADVKEFARKMVDAHKNCNNQLLEHAKGLKIAVVAGLEKDQRDTDSRLSKLSGEDFDREYMKQMVADHEKAARMVEAYSTDGENKELRDFAKETLPKIREHIAEAKRIQKKLGA